MDQDSSDNIHPLSVEDNLHTRKIILNGSISCDGSIVIISPIPEEESNYENFNELREKKDFIIGVLFQIWAVLFVTMGHSLWKMLSIHSPYITPFDLTLFMGFFNTPFYLFIGYQTGTNLNLFSYPRKMIILVITRVLVGLTNNIFIIFAISQIPLSKSIFIFSLNPICWAILATIFLKERINKITIMSIFGAAIGIYTLTLNKAEDGKGGSLSGYISMLWAIWLTGLLFILIRSLNQNGIHLSLVNSVLGFSFLVQPLIVSMFK